MRLIDADELLREHGDDVTNWDEPYAVCNKSIMNAHTVDAVQVIRCKECEYSAGQTLFSGDKIYCRELRCYMDESDFCSHGIKG